MNNKEFNLIVAGGRNFDDYSLLSRKIEHLLSKKIQTHTVGIVSGGCRGADRMAERWAKKNRVDLYKVDANWCEYGRAAGPLRNEQMAVIGDALLAFWDGKSKGTKNMIETMQKAGKPVRIVRY